MTAAEVENLILEFCTCGLQQKNEDNDVRTEARYRAVECVRARGLAKQTRQDKELRELRVRLLKVD
jgi:Zn ribbon nucleic-acid-binding protein